MGYSYLVMCFCAQFLSCAQTGTRIVKDICPGSGSSSPRNLIVFQDMLYFTADDCLWGAELWRSDGTDVGTQRVMDLCRGSCSGMPRFLTVFQDDVSLRPPTAQLSQPYNTSIPLVSPPLVGGPAHVPEARLFFTANAGVFGSELWVSDGTLSGTRRAFQVQGLSCLGCFNCLARTHHVLPHSKSLPPLCCLSIRGRTSGSMNV